VQQEARPHRLQAAPLLPVLLPAVMEETPVTMDEALAGADQVESDRGAET